MQKVIDLLAMILSSRRLIAAVISIAVATMSACGIYVNQDVETTTNLLMDVVQSLSGVLIAALAFWSFAKPKK